MNTIKNIALGMLAGIVATVVFLTSVNLVNLWRERSEHSCSLIHKPKTGCPPGWKLQKDTFKEKNGSMLDSCLEPSYGYLEACIDELRPGESFITTIDPVTGYVPPLPDDIRIKRRP